MNNDKRLAVLEEQNLKLKSRVDSHTLKMANLEKRVKDIEKELEELVCE